MTHLTSLGILFGRIFLSTIFILAGASKLINYNDTAAYMASKGMTMIPFFLVAAAIVELSGGLLVLLGYKARYGAIILALFLIPTTMIFHDFWNLEGAEKQAQMIEFLKNLGIMGGLLYVISVGSGKYCLDSCCGMACRSKNRE